MSDKTLVEPVRRFVNWCAVTHGHEMLEAAQGLYVLYSDYERLERERDALARYRKVLQEVHVLCAAMNSGRTHYDGCSADHPWCEVYSKVSRALAEDPID